MSAFSRHPLGNVSYICDCRHSLPFFPSYLSVSVPGSEDTELFLLQICLKSFFLLSIKDVSLQTMDENALIVDGGKKTHSHNDLDVFAGSSGDFSAPTSFIGQVANFHLLCLHVNLVVTSKLKAYIYIYFPLEITTKTR